MRVDTLSFIMRLTHINVKTQRMLVKVGVLGGGQLARMLVMEAPRLGIQAHVLCGSIDDPAAQVCPHAQIGRLDLESDLRTFISHVDAVTIESEFVNTTVLETALGKSSCHPAPRLLERFQDRLSQKEILKEHRIPTSPFIAWNAETPPQDLLKTFKPGAVVKKRRFGYDGYGTFVVQKGKLPEIRPEAFGYIAEQFIPFTRELAFSLARNQKNQFAVFPLVETKQVNSRCLWVKGPVRHSKFAVLVRSFKRLMTDLDYRGILAVELFDVRGKLIVNELAPRVHNSAHYSMDALSLSQFEAHLRGVLNWPLENPKPLVRAFAMVNLLGEKPQKPVRLSRDSAGRLHWYGKKENRAGRKMGHINTFGKTPDAALKEGLKWRKEFQL